MRLCNYGRGHRPNSTLPLPLPSDSKCAATRACASAQEFGHSRTLQQRAPTASTTSSHAYARAYRGATALAAVPQQRAPSQHSNIRTGSSHAHTHAHRRHGVHTAAYECIRLHAHTCTCRRDSHSNSPARAGASSRLHQGGCQQACARERAEANRAGCSPAMQAPPAVCAWQENIHKYRQAFIISMTLGANRPSAIGSTWEHLLLPSSL